MKKREVRDFLKNLKKAGISVEEYLAGLEALKELMERKVIYTGGFRMYGKATVAECYCSRCGGTFWVNYRAPSPYCVDCDTTPIIRDRVFRPCGHRNEAVEDSEFQYQGGEIENLASLPNARRRFLKGKTTREDQ